MKTFENSLTKKHRVLPTIKKIPTTDEIDFSLKAKLHGACKVCNGGKLSVDCPNYLRRDPTMYDFIVKSRAALKEARMNK